MSIGENFEAELDQTVEKVMEAWGITGLALAVVNGDERALAKGYGQRDHQHPGQVDEHTLFAIASNTKAFTATAIGLLVQEGRLRWDAPVTEYLPWFRLYDEHATQLLTVRDLLCHRSGLGTWAGDMLQLSDYTVEEVIRRVRHIPPAYPFRAGYGYSNLMFITAGLVLSTVSGMSWDDFIGQRLLTPIGMERSITSVRFLGGRENIALPHVEIDGKLRTVPPRTDGSFGAAGDIISSAGDLSLWLQLQLNEGSLNGRQIVDPAIIRETHTPHTIMPFQPSPAEKRALPSMHFAAYGLGWFLNDFHGRMMIRHTGGLDGMLSITAMFPEEKIGIAVLTNKQPSLGFLALSYHLLDRLLGINERDWVQAFLEIDAERKELANAARERTLAGRVPGTHTSLPLKELAGTYESRTLGGASLLTAGRKLHIQLEAHESLSGELMHWHYDTFLCKWDDPVLGESLIPFITDGQGHVTEFRVKVREDWIDPLEHVFVKVQMPEAVPERKQD